MTRGQEPALGPRARARRPAPAARDRETFWGGVAIGLVLAVAGALGFWLTAMSVGAAYYFIPKVLGRPIYSYQLSLLGFWSLAMFYSLNGMHHLVGGPIPEWMITTSIVASIFMFIPVVATGIKKLEPPVADD